MKKVKINGADYPCALTIGVLKKFKDETGKELEEVKDVFSICSLLFTAVTAACRKEHKLFPYSSAEELMDEIEFADIERITVEMFGMGQGDPAGGQKKTTVRRSTASSGSRPA